MTKPLGSELYYPAGTLMRTSYTISPQRVVVEKPDWLSTAVIHGQVLAGISLEIVSESV